MVLNPFKRKLVGDILVHRGIITKEQLETALEQQETSDEKVTEIMLRLGMVKEKDILEALAFQKGVEYIRLHEVEAGEELKKLIPEDMARRFNAVPVRKSGNAVVFAMTNPSDVIAIEEIEKSAGVKVTPAIASRDDIEKHIEKVYGGFAGLSNLTESIDFDTASPEDTIPEIEDGEYDAEDTPIVKYVSSVIAEAIKKNTTDIHIEPLPETVLVRLRIDGQLREFPGPAKKAYPAIASRIKILSGLDIAERRLPQDGKVAVDFEGVKVNIRVSTLPTIYGEKIVMRILRQSGLSLDLESLGFTENDLKLYKDALNSPLGMILVTGPTGSGKTTTLYSGLNYINKPEKNITTVEDPVEYQLKRINQVQVKNDINLTFARFLRTVLRQDPDVIMVGEIRDRETAEIAVQAALTGHLVLSTLHTNDAVSTLTRLRYMGIDSFLVADAVNLVIAQRLLRKICPDCKEEIKLVESVLNQLNLKPDKNTVLYKGQGCEKCFEAGYLGRTAVYEMLPVTEGIKKLIIEKVPEASIRKEAVKQGLVTLRQAAVQKMLDGITTLDEVLTVTF